MTARDLGQVGASTQSRKVIETAVGVVLFGAAWEIVGRTEVLTTSWPPLSDVVAALVDADRAPRLWRALGTTMGAGFAGGAVGTGVAILAALVSRLLPRTRGPAERFAALVEAVPVVALGPLLLVLLPRETLPTALAATAAYFAAFVVVCTGLWARRPGQTELFAVLGARRAMVLARLDMPAAVPSFFSALQLAIPAALLGAVIGEWFGASSGIGPLLINSMQNYDIPTLWAAGTLTAIPASLVYGVASVLHRLSLRRFAL